jgi:hypothetical protein
MRGGHGLPVTLAALIMATAAVAQPAATPPDGGVPQATSPKAADAPTNAPGATTHGAAPAPADKPAEGSNCLFFGPTFGSEVLNLGWNTSPATIGVLPGLRGGVWLPGGFAAGELGLKLGVSPSSRSTTVNFKLGGSYAHDLGTMGAMKVYGLGGLDAQLEAGTSGGFGSVTPLFGFTIGSGLEYPLNNEWTLGGELGLHTLFDVSTSVGVTTGLYVSVVGSWSLAGACTSHPGTVSPPDQPAGGTLPPYEPPTAPPEVITHNDSYNTPCSVYVSDGWMEPTQGVWQDDVSFEDKPGKQLTRLNSDAVAYVAELPMTVGKPTLLFGVHHYLRGGAPTHLDSRDFIVLAGFTNCSTPKPVKFRFRMANGGSPQVLYESPEVGQIKLTGPAKKDYEAWSVRLPVRNGVPAENSFTIDNAGGYTITAELLAEGNPTGLEMTVSGEARKMTGPVVHFVPVLLSKRDAAGEAELIAKTEAMEKDTATKVPDWFPVGPGGLPTSTRVLRNMVDLQVPDRWLEARRISYVVASLNDTLAASAFLDGAGRVVAVMSGEDFKSIFGTGAAGMMVSDSVNARQRGNAARTLSWKVMLVPQYESWDTVAHEILHTLPEGWAEDEMQAECGHAYHNKEDPLAHGERVTDDGAPTLARERMAGKISFMGPWEVLSKVWMDQCTYWHLTKMLTAPPDPPVLMVRAMIGAGKKGKPMGELRPAYEVQGASDLADNPKGGGPYAFVFKGAGDKVLARFPFNPREKDIETRAKLEVLSWVGRVPIVPGWTSLELQGPGGAVLDKKTRSETPPQISIDAPKDLARVVPSPPGNTVKVFWTAKPAVPSLPLLSSVLYSSDRGAHWTDQALEIPGNAWEVKLAPKATEHLVKIVTTDGTRSAEAIIRLLTAAPAPAK